MEFLQDASWALGDFALYALAGVAVMAAWYIHRAVSRVLEVLTAVGNLLRRIFERLTARLEPSEDGEPVRRFQLFPDIETRAGVMMRASVLLPAVAVVAFALFRLVFKLT